MRNDVHAAEWYAGNIARSKAERLVLGANLPAGTFLIREREIAPKEYALTIRDRDSANGAPSVKHYRIKLLERNEGCFITSRTQFRSLKQLVKYYQGAF